MIKPKRALISVYTKKGIVDFCSALEKVEIELYATPGTKKFLCSHGIKVHDTESYTGFSEILGGRVKTLHTNIHAAILARRQDIKHVRKQHVEPIDMVVCNFYPYKFGIEEMDIGGPAMIRAAAKNWKRVVVVSHPNQYTTVKHHLQKGFDDAVRYELAVEALRRTSYYDAILALNASEMLFPAIISFPYFKKYTLRYGENPHQQAAFYAKEGATEPSVVTALKIQGKELSYNNILDAHHAIECIKEFEKPSAVIIKHATPSGIASALSVEKAWNDAFATDVYSPFGGVVAINRPLNEALAKEMSSIFLEVIIAPSFKKEALTLLKKKKNLRLLKIDKLGHAGRLAGIEIRSVGEGLLAQERDTKPINSTAWQTITKKQPTKKDLGSMIFALKCVRHVKSNSVVFVKGTKTVGIGGGQTSRVDATWIATHKGRTNIKNSIMASDAFFPFRDAVDVAAQAGVRAIIQPGGSIRDEEIIQAANEHGIIMVFTGQRYFLH